MQKQFDEAFASLRTRLALVQCATEEQQGAAKQNYLAMPKSLRITLWNANGLLSRKLELDYSLQTEHIDLTLITETHCTAKFAFAETRQYLVYHTRHSSGKAQGGTAIYIKKSMAHTLGSVLATNCYQITCSHYNFKVHPLHLGWSIFPPQTSLRKLISLLSMLNLAHVGSLEATSMPNIHTGELAQQHCVVASSMQGPFTTPLL